ncbi:MAG: hypothetical protein ACO3EE_01095 [Flavobacteriales bacterium]
MKHFLKTIFYFVTPAIVIFLLLLLGYILLDPFKIIYNYEDFSKRECGLNRDYVSTEMLLRNKENHKYNSFIFGSSRALAFRPSSWQKHLKDKDKAFTFDASAESIFGIWKKFLFLKENNIKIDNALIVICRDITFNLDVNHIDFLFLKHPLVSKESWYRFHYIFLRGYFNKDFLYHYYRYKITNQFDNSMVGYLEKEKYSIDGITNEMITTSIEDELKKNEKHYYENRSRIFYPRKGETTDSQIRIKPSQKKMLEDILAILKSDSTNFKVVISPLYDQRKLSPEDKETLQNLFGDNLYDFSGCNELTSTYKNYYETSHYRSFIADSILNYIYKK